jgi:hypothetical protein
MGPMPAPTSAERSLLRAVSARRMMSDVRRLASWVRLAGSDDEARAFDHLEATLRELGLEVSSYAHPALISLPGLARLRLPGKGGRRLRCITHSFAVSTPPVGLVGELVDVGGGDPAGRLDGNIALVDGLAGPPRVRQLQEAGAVGAVFVNPPQLHEMIVSPVWGSPSAESIGQLPRLVAVSVRQRDGDLLRERLRAGQTTTRIEARVETGWRDTPLLTADLAPGRSSTGRAAGHFVLFSGHVDSWHRGAMDNGSANAVQLETARLLAARRGRLRRGVRFAFWSGHSHGRYSGSTWYADSHWADLHRNAVLHLNVDSPGGRDADNLAEAPTMAETWASAADAIREVAGQTLAQRRVSRFGDQSFWGVGLPSLFVSLSSQPTGGLGWWWHTPADTPDKVDPVRLRRDARIYALLLWRWCTVPTLPLDYRATAAELRQELEVVGGSFDVGPALAGLEMLAAAAERLAALADRAARSPRLADALDDALVRVGRVLTPVLYTRAGPFDHDPALPIGYLPGLQPARALATLDPDARNLALVGLVRERNRLVHALETAAAIADGVR